MKPENVRALVIFALLLVVVVGGYWISGMGARARVKQVQKSVIVEVDAERSLGETLAAHPLGSSLAWQANWSGDTHLVCANLGLQRLDQLPKPLLAELGRLVAMTPEWKMLAPERAGTLSIVFRLQPGSEATVTVESVRLSEGWVIYQEAKVAAYESALEDSIAHSDNHREAVRYRLLHEGDSAYFNLGLVSPTLAGAGMSMPGVAWLAAFAHLAAATE